MWGAPRILAPFRRLGRLLKISSGKTILGHMYRDLKEEKKHSLVNIIGCLHL